MYLDRVEEAMLNGEYGDGYRKAMEILVAIGKIYGAERLIPISSAHISGISYRNIGDEGLEFLRELSRDVNVSVYTTMNPSGFDLLKWRSQGVDEEFVSKQREIIDTLRSMGVRPTLTCTPYLTLNLPGRGEHVAWSESSAITYINSVVGARSNRESGISALASAIVGKVPYYGLHLDENREPNILINVSISEWGEDAYGVIGYIIGKEFPGMIPYIRGLKNVTDDSLKQLSASISTYGGIPLYHIEGVTPESWRYRPGSESFIIDDEMYNRAYSMLMDELDDVNLIWIGCPHASIGEIHRVASIVRGRSLKRELIITTSRMVYNIAERHGYVKVIEDSGGVVYADTCLVVSPFGDRYGKILTPSVKAYYYLSSMLDAKVIVRPLDECIKYALGD